MIDESDIVSKLDAIISSVGSLEQMVSAIAVDKQSSWSDDAIEDPAMPVGDEGFASDRSAFSLSYSEDDIVVVNCHFRLSRQLYRIEDVSIGGTPSGLCVLHIDHSSPESSTVKIAESCENTDQVSEIPLYRFNQGTVEQDFRSVPVLQIYE